MNDAEIEDRLRRAYEAVAARTVVAPFVLPGTAETLRPAPPPPYRERRVVALVAAGLAVGLAAVAVVATGGGDGGGDRSAQVDTTQAEVTQPLTGGAGTIEQLPEAPLSARYGHSAVWTGTEMIVVGGINDDDNDGEFDETDAASREGDAAAYDPAARSWRTLAEPPDVVAGSTSSVWAGGEMVVLATDWDDTVNSSAPPDQAAGAVYDPAEDAWRDVAPFPGELGDLHPDSAAFWLGGRVVVLGTQTPDGLAISAGNGAAAYDPATDEWSALGDVPLVFDAATAVVTGDEVVVVGPDRTALDGVTVAPDAHLEAVALDPAAGTWRPLPAPPLPVRSDPLLAWTGTDLVVLGGNGVGGQGPLSDGARFDPATESWVAVPEAPAALPPQEPAGPAGAVVGRQVVVGTATDAEVGPLVLDLATGSWRTGPPWPLPRFGGDARVSSGRQLLTWGGYGDDTEAIAQGFALTPSPG